MISKRLLTLSNKIAISFKQKTHSDRLSWNLKAFHRDLATAVPVTTRDFIPCASRTHSPYSRVLVTSVCSSNTQQKRALHISCHLSCAKHRDFDQWDRIKREFRDAVQQMQPGTVEDNKEKIESFRESSENIFDNSLEKRLPYLLEDRERTLLYQHICLQWHKAKSVTDLEKYRDQKQILPDDSREVTLVQDVYKKLKRSNPILCRIPSEVYVVADPSLLNAYSYMNGTIFVGKEGVNNFDNPNVIAVMLAHEMGHIAMSHGQEQTSNNLYLRNYIWHLAAGLCKVYPEERVLGEIKAEIDVTKNLLLPGEDKLELEADLFGTLAAAKAEFHWQDVYTAMDEAKKLWPQKSQKEEDEKKKEAVESRRNRRHEWNQGFFKNLPTKVGEVIDEKAAWTIFHPSWQTRKITLKRRMDQLLGSGDLKSVIRRWD